MTQQDKTTRRARNSTTNQNYIVFSINTNKTQITSRHTNPAVPPRHASALHNPGRIGTLTDRPTMTMHTLHAVSRPLAGKVVPLHHTCMTATARLRDHIHPLPFSQISRRQNLTDLQPVLSVFTTKFPSKPTRLTTRFQQNCLTSCLTHLLTAATNVSHLTSIGATGQPPRLLTNPQLNSIVPIAINGSYLSYNARTRLNNRHRDYHPAVGVDLRHTNFFSKQPNRHNTHQRDNQKVKRVRRLHAERSLPKQE
jgi:hypothetical protein